jgi:predicted transcriptional regulator
MNTRVLQDLIQSESVRPSRKVVGTYMILCPDPQTAVEIAKATGLDRSTVTRSLHELREMEIVGKDRHGLWVGEIG